MVRIVAGPVGRTIGRIVLVAAVAVSVAYAGFLRPMQMRWGSTDVERARQMPGDRVIGNATFVATRAVTIDATTKPITPIIRKVPKPDRSLFVV